MRKLKEKVDFGNLKSGDWMIWGTKDSSNKLVIEISFCDLKKGIIKDVIIAESRCEINSDDFEISFSNRGVEEYSFQTLDRYMKDWDIYLLNDKEKKKYKEEMLLSAL